MRGALGSGLAIQHLHPNEQPTDGGVIAIGAVRENSLRVRRRPTTGGRRGLASVAALGVDTVQMSHATERFGSGVK